MTAQLGSLAAAAHQAPPDPDPDPRLHPLSCPPAHPPVRRWRLAPSPFFSSLLALKEAKLSTWSTTPQLATFLRKGSGSSHLEPKAEARRVRVSLVWESKAGFSTRQLTKTQR